jgi:hypothetical protein
MDMVFWFIGANASIMKKYFLNAYQNMKKKMDKKSRVYILIFYVHLAKFCREKIFLVAYGKKDKKKSHK